MWQKSWSLNSVLHSLKVILLFSISKADWKRNDSTWSSFVVDIYVHHDVNVDSLPAKLNLSSYVGCNHCHLHCLCHQGTGYENTLFAFTVYFSLTSFLSWMEHTKFLFCSTLMFNHCSLILLWAGHEHLIKLFQSILCVESLPSLKTYGLCRLPLLALSHWSLTGGVWHFLKWCFLLPKEIYRPCECTKHSLIPHMCYY